MAYISLNPEENHKILKMNTLITKNRVSGDPTQIKQGMSPSEIANIVSDHLIDVVKQKFEETKKEFQKKLEEAK